MSLLLAVPPTYTAPGGGGGPQTGVLVSDYAAGDGTDETTELQNAIDAAIAASDNLIFEAGKTYGFDRIVFTGFDNATVYGNDAWIKATDTSLIASGGPNVQFISNSNFTVDRLNMHGNRSVRGSIEVFSGHLLMLQDCHIWTVSDCDLTEGPTDCMRLSSFATPYSSASDFGLITGCLITNAGRLGIGIIEAHDIRVTDCTFRDTAKSDGGLSGYAPGCAIDIEPNGGSPDNGSSVVCSNIEIDNNLAEDCWGGGFEVAAGGGELEARIYNDNINIHHNDITNCGGKALTVGAARNTGIYLATGAEMHADDNTIICQAIDPATPAGDWGSIAVAINTVGEPVTIRRNVITHVAGYTARGIHIQGINDFELRCPECLGYVQDNSVDATVDTNTPAIYINPQRVNWVPIGDGGGVEGNVVT